ncbi:heme o synthase [Brevibacillus dissolubilis]|uniref:heme o synthase n=1 Tax=Brevibacillus dissolubilis TaxID=1844116 RepID=UPI001116B189|nr:heme o synthase [Brevibacillus dissolubilis]
MEHEATLKNSDSPFPSATDTFIQEKSATWRDYWQLTKPGIILSNLLTTFAGFWVASEASPDVATLIFTMLGAALIIGSGGALNNYWDRELDQKMQRTKNRATATGKVHPRNVLVLGLVLLVASLVVLTLLVNPLAAVCALMGHIFYVLIYTPMKRVTTLNTVIGGISGAMPPLIGWAAVTENLDPGAWILFLILFLWQSPHFLALAMLKVEDYRSGGLPMLPVVRGFAETKRQMFFWGAALLPVSLMLFLYAPVGYVYLATATILGVIYLVLLFQGFKTKDDIAWAKKLFGYSLIYLTGMCAAMIISAI